jgi:hypothetical protein
MQPAEDLIARLVATYPEEADLVHDVVRGVLDERREGAKPVRKAEAEADERLARLLRARSGPPTGGTGRGHHAPRESHDGDPSVRRANAARAAARRRSGVR